MKEIQPIQIWKNGEVKTASVLDAIIINDDLQSTCTFYWQIKEADTIVPADEEVEGSADQVIPGQTLDQGNTTVSGEEYLNWDGSNNYAYFYIAQTLNITLL